MGFIVEKKTGSQTAAQKKRMAGARKRSPTYKKRKLMKTVMELESNPRMKSMAKFISSGEFTLPTKKPGKRNH